MTRGVNDRITITRTIQAAVPAGDAMLQVVVNSTVFNFSRTSAEGSLPMISKVVIGPVSSSLNGTMMNCIDLSTTSSAATTIIVGEREPLQGTHTIIIIIIMAILFPHLIIIKKYIILHACFIIFQS